MFGEYVCEKGFVVGVVGVLIFEPIDGVL